MTGTIDFNQRNVAIVQAQIGGFVQRVYGRAPGDVVGAGAPIADLLIPEWGGAQAEVPGGQDALATKQAAARHRGRRLRLLGHVGWPDLPGRAHRPRQWRRHHHVPQSAGSIQTLDVRRA